MKMTELEGYSLEGPDVLNDNTEKRRRREIFDNWLLALAEFVPDPTLNAPETAFTHTTSRKFVFSALVARIDQLVGKGVQDERVLQTRSVKEASGIHLEYPSIIPLDNPPRMTLTLEANPERRPYITGECRVTTQNFGDVGQIGFAITDQQVSINFRFLNLISPEFRITKRSANASDIGGLSLPFNALRGLISLYAQTAGITMGYIKYDPPGNRR